MKKIFIVFAMLLILPLNFHISVAGDSYEEALNYIRAKKYEQAKAVLRQELIDMAKKKANKGKMADANFYLGICYLNTGAVGQANEYFQTAVGLKNSYGKEIGGAYKEGGSFYLRLGKVDLAKEAYRKAIIYEPNLKKSIAVECAATAKTYIGWEQKIADDLFAVAISYDYGLRDKVCADYFAPGDAADDEKAIDLYPQNPVSYCGDYNEKAGKKILESAKNLARKPGKEKQATKAKELAMLFCGAKVNIELPEIKYFGDGQHSFGKFKAGEQTPFWFATKIGDHNFQFLADKKNAKFTIVTSGGERFRWWDEKEKESFCNKQWGNERFKAEFHEDMEFGINVKKS